LWKIRKVINSRSHLHVVDGEYPAYQVLDQIIDAIGE
jgi:hypothetical protein